MISFTVAGTRQSSLLYSMRVGFLDIQVRLCAVWPMKSWLGSSLNQIQSWTTVIESYCHALEQGTLVHVGETEEVINNIPFVPSSDSRMDERTSREIERAKVAGQSAIFSSLF